jgi:hypothetical protein
LILLSRSGKERQGASIGIPVFQHFFFFRHLYVDVDVEEFYRTYKQSCSPISSSRASLSAIHSQLLHSLAVLDLLLYAVSPTLLAQLPAAALPAACWALIPRRCTDGRFYTSDVGALIFQLRSELARVRKI